MTAHRILVRYGLAFAALGIASAACAEETVISLSPAAKEKLLNAAASRDEPSLGEPEINRIGRQMHGEVGMMIGTNGARGMFGSAVAPIGQNGSVAVAFENTRFGRHR